MKKIFFTLISIYVFASMLMAQTTFIYTGTVQTYTVSSCVFSIAVDVKAASGATTGNGNGGKGGRVQAVIPVTPAAVVNIYVGGSGGIGAGGWNGGGGGGSGGGGGASDIRIGGTAFSNRVVVAGGGGGGGVYYVSGNNGGDGGGLIGDAGWVGTTQGHIDAGGGGTQTSGGAGSGNGSTAGSVGTGGLGSNTFSGGAGGAGYYGGGGGEAGGGGGSSYTTASASGVIHTQGFQTGDGQIIITPIVSTGPAAPGTITGASSACSGTSGNYFISPVPNATTYTWTAPPGATITGQGTASVTVTFGLSSGNISVTASNSCGTSAASTMSVTVTANLPVSAGNDETLCNGQSTTLIASGGTNYLWSTGETTAAITVSPSASANYTVSASDASGCSGTDEVMVTVNSLPAASAGPDVTICVNGNTQLNATGGTNYSWSTGETTASITVSPAASTSYTVVVSDSTGCSGADEVTVTVDSCVTGIASVNENKNIIITPNPTVGKFKVSQRDSFGGSLKLKVRGLEIYNVMGEKVFELKDAPVKDEPFTIDFSEYPVGIYFLKLKSQNGITVHKVVKQ